jgi:MoaA/NifB/PqqE/SkfB family radical SAM enzyme
MDSIKKFNRAVYDYFLGVMRANLSNPGLLPFLFATAITQKKAAQKRNLLKASGINVPPLMIFTLTNRCNLGCAGCYNRMRGEKKGEELSTKELTGILEQASALGVSVALLAGGEPLLRGDIFTFAEKFREMVFPVFTNGLAIDDEMAAKFKANRNLVPIISVEGEAELTDLRRGAGTFKGVMEAFKKLKKRGVLFGTSITATSKNLEHITSDGFLGAMRRANCGLFFFVEYVPVEGGSEELVLGAEKKKKLVGLMPKLDKQHKAVFITFPGDESAYGGCLASGRGFVHVNPHGGLEPCPFAPFSDTDLRKTPLRQALSSELLEKIRRRHGELNETSGGCALWNKKDWVDSLMK